MVNQAKKSPDNQDKTIANQQPQIIKGRAATLSFVDNRPETNQLARIQAMMNESPQTKNLVQLPAMINDSPSILAQQQQIEGMFGTAVHRQEASQEEELQMKAQADPAQGQDLEDDALHLNAESLPLQRQPVIGEEALIQGKFPGVQSQGGLEEKDRGREKPTMPTVVQAVLRPVVQRQPIDLSAAVEIKPGPPPTVLSGNYYYKIFGSKSSGPGGETGGPSWNLLSSRWPVA